MRHKPGLSWTSLLLLLAAPPLLSQGSVETHRLTPSHGEVGFGNSVALANGVALVGDPGHADLGSYAGAVFLFDSQSGIEFGELLASDGDAGDYFGSAIAVAGDLAVISAFNDDHAGARSGSAYVFDVATGQELHKLTASDAGPDQWFGISVDTDGVLAVVGATGHYSSPSLGAAYVFDLASGQQLLKLQPVDNVVADLFGSSVAISGNRILVGSPHHDDDGSVSGAAYVFDATTGAQLVEWTLIGGATNARFGHAVALEGDLAVVGAYNDVVGGVRTGSAYLFDVSSSAQLHKLHASDGASEDHFAFGVDLLDGLALVGAPWAKPNQSYFEKGAAYLFEVSTGRQVDKLITAESCALGRSVFGTTVALGDGLALGGAPGCHSGAHLFDVSLASAIRFCEGVGCPCANDDSAAGCGNSTGVGARLDAHGSTSVLADDLVLDASLLPAQTLGLFFMGDRQVALPFGDGLRCVGGHLERFGPPRTSGVSGELSVGPGIVATSCPGGGVPTTCIDAGSTWNFQAWYRDAQGTCGSGFNLSGGVSVLFLP